MKIVIIELVIILVILVVIILLSLLIIKKVRGFLMEYFNTPSLKQAIENSKITDSETHKSVASMESIYNDRLLHDFPELNLNELKSDAEKSIRNVLLAIETKDVKGLNNKNDKIIAYVNSKIEDLKDSKVCYDNITFHKTVLNRYEVKSGFATIEFQSSLEYFYKKGNEIGRKTQTRFKTQFIYIVDYLKLPKNIKSLGINCPNCGAPVKMLGNKNCEYCGTKVIDITNRTWMLNNIKEY